MFHEWGHFLAARSLKLKVVEYAIGFGPTLFSFKTKKTKYSIRALPLGGYVLVASKELGEYLEVEFKHKESLDSLNFWKKTYFYSAGVAFNFLLAIVLSLFYFVDKDFTHHESYGKFIGVSFTSVIEGIVNLFSHPGSIHSIGQTIAGASTSDHWATIFYKFMIVISINLGIFNILPIPPLDGYKVVEAGYESIRKKKLPDWFRIGAAITGTLFLLLLTIWPFINDYVF